MKSIITAVIFLSAATFCSHTNATKPNEEYQNNRQKYNLAGPVQSIIEFNYKQYVPDSVLTYYVTKQYYKFNVAGNCTELTTFLEQESFQNRYVYQYDAAGNYTELTSYTEDSSLDFRVTYTFDDEGNMIEMINFSRYGDIKYRQQCTYGPNRSFVQYRSGVQLSGAPSTYRYTYDAAGRRTSEDYYPDEKKLKRRTVWVYRGDTTEKTEHDSWGNVSTKVLDVYDKNNRLVTHVVHFFDAELTDYEGNYKYDTRGNTVEYIQTNSAGIDIRESYRCVYEYDKKGNWIKRTTYKADGNLKSSIERKIEYYN